jgi:phosphoribosyl 1,2-cyclic phosphodiesterase
MDDNTTKVVLTAIVLAFVVAIMRQFDRVSLHIERLKIDIFGLLKVGATVLNVAMQRRQRSKRCRVNHSDDIAWAAAFAQGSFALNNTIRRVPGNHDIDMIVVTHPDGDHLNGLLHFFQCPHHGSR